MSDECFCPYTGVPRTTRYHESKALGDIVYIHKLRHYSNQDLLGLRSELVDTMPGPWMPLHTNHRHFIESIDDVLTERNASTDSGPPAA